MMNDTLLHVNDLRVHVMSDDGVIPAVDGVSFSVREGATVGVVGESGCGKTLTALSILNLVTKPVQIVGGEIHFRTDNGEVLDLAALKPNGRIIRLIRGNQIAMIFQEPMNSLSPVHTIGFQIMQAYRIHHDVSKQEARQHAIDLLNKVEIPNAERLVDAYTFQLSGGMRQRAMIAMALACNPKLLIADEPTTALDVTTQAQILDLLAELQAEYGMSIILVTHDLGVVAEVCDEVVVMYLGEVVEQASVETIFERPLHPYTEALVRSMPKLGLGRSQVLSPIQGAIPNPSNRPSGCPFHTRCPHRLPNICNHVKPKVTQLADGRTVRCVLYESQLEEAPHAH